MGIRELVGWGCKSCGGCCVLSLVRGIRLSGLFGLVFLAAQGETLLMRLREKHWLTGRSTDTSSHSTGKGMATITLVSALIFTGLRFLIGARRTAARPSQQSDETINRASGLFGMELLAQGHLALAGDGEVCHAFWTRWRRHCEAVLPCAVGRGMRRLADLEGAPPARLEISE